MRCGHTSVVKHLHVLEQVQTVDEWLPYYRPFVNTTSRRNAVTDLSIENEQHLFILIFMHVLALKIKIIPIC